MAPLPWSRIWRSSCFMQAHTPRRLMALTRSNTLGGLVGGVAGRDLDAGVVECHVEPAEGRDGPVDHGGDLSSSDTSQGDAEDLVPAAA